MNVEITYPQFWIAFVQSSIVRTAGWKHRHDVMASKDVSSRTVPDTGFVLRRSDTTAFLTFSRTCLFLTSHETLKWKWLYHNVNKSVLLKHLYTLLYIRTRHVFVNHFAPNIWLPLKKSISNTRHTRLITNTKNRRHT